MIDGVMRKTLRVIPDERGRLMECLRCDDELFLKFGQLYMTTTLPGVVKGWHLHHVQYDNIVCVKGMIKLVLFDGREGSPSEGRIDEFFMGDHNPLLVRVPPEVQHGWKCVSTDEAFIVNAPDRALRLRRARPGRAAARHRPDPLRLGPAAALARRLARPACPALTPLTAPARAGSSPAAAASSRPPSRTCSRARCSSPAKPSSTCATRPPWRPRCAPSAPTSCCTPPPTPTSTAPKRTRQRRAPSTCSAPGNLVERRARHARAGRVVLERLRLRRPQGRAVRRARRARTR